VAEDRLVRAWARLRGVATAASGGDDPPPVETPGPPAPTPQDDQEDERRRWAEVVLMTRGHTFVGYDTWPPGDGRESFDPWG
jgi:hypothetical protein